MILPDLVIAPSPKGGKDGRGVYTTRNLQPGTIIEMSPVLVLSANDYAQVKATKLYYYVFEWGKSLTQAAIGLGYISLYNHSYSANCAYDMDFGEGLMTITVVKPVKKGEELFINYNSEPDDTTPIWFKAK